MPTKLKENPCSDGMLSIAQAAEFANLSESQIYKLSREERVLEYRVIGKRILIPKLALIEFLNNAKPKKKTSTSEKTR